MFDFQQLMGLQQKPAAKSGRAAMAKMATASAARPQFGGNDPLSGFVNQLKSGGIQFNPNKPALPYTASKSWCA